MIKISQHFSGKWFVLFSYYAYFTHVYTTEFVAFQKRYDKFKKLNCELIGLFVNQVFSHIEWTEWIKGNLDTEIQFLIIADTANIAEVFSLIHPEEGINTVRAVFIVDQKAIIRTILYYPQEIGKNMDLILKIIKGFQVSDKNNVAIPASYTNNEIISDEEIIPPVKDEKTAKERVKDYNYFDLWL